MSRGILSRDKFTTHKFIRIILRFYNTRGVSRFLIVFKMFIDFTGEFYMSIEVLQIIQLVGNDDIINNNKNNFHVRSQNYLFCIGHNFDITFFYYYIYHFCFFLREERRRKKYT
mgnify:CR=1 FL=1